MQFKREKLDIVRYHPTKGNVDSPRVLEWTGVEFVRRVAALVPPPRRHMVRYYGALGPRSPLRRAVSSVARGKASDDELERGYDVTPAGAAVRAVAKAARAAGRGWAACLRKIFEVNPVLCVRCGVEMKLAAVILDDGELSRILAHEGWPVDFPKTRPSRAPPARGPDGEGQLDPRVEKWDGRDAPPGDEPA